MREIKFRGKAECGIEELEEQGFEHENGWIYGTYLDGYIVNGVVESTDEYIALEEWYPVKIETVGQCTGLKDKNGKEIYEGDIVRAWSEGYCGTFEIRWREDGGGSPMFILYPAWQNREMWFLCSAREEDGKCYDRGLEVIGNIHDNPELLEVV